MVPLFPVAVMAFCCLILPLTTTIAAPSKSTEDQKLDHASNSALSPVESPSSMSSAADEEESEENEASPQQQYQPLTNAEKLAKLTILVKTFKLEDCAGRVLCDLNCNPVAYGSEGKRVLRMLVNIQTSGDMDKDEMRFYLNAAMTGRKAKFAHGDCHQCTDTFPNCVSSSKDVVELASLLRINH